METILTDIISELKTHGQLDEKQLAKIIHRHNKGRDTSLKPYAKKRLLPYYLKIKDNDPERWSSWNIDPVTEQLLLKLLQVKPRRTASGVATITVITKPWKCSSDCIYCPNDLRMPKSYLSDEPACQRAERNFFDPYLQVVSRIRALTHMGHVTDKIELIILGGTWSDYPESYQIWYVSELFRALNDADDAESYARRRRKYYKEKGLIGNEDDLASYVENQQRLIANGSTSYNHAMDMLYKGESIWSSIATDQVADFDQLERQHTINETAAHRVVGLVIETRPDMITPRTLTLIRRLGCTKVQMGIQSLDPAILEANNRTISIDRIRQSFSLLRIFGFKIHAHFMLNLLGSTPEADKQDYRHFVTDRSFLPDEVKLYPCSLVVGTTLCSHYDNGSWKPYTEEELLDVLVTDTLATPPYVRISRMIRDISAHDIVAGNKKANLRQLVENRIEARGDVIQEIRYREISTDEVNVADLTLVTVPYSTTATDEMFLQWITPENRIVGFLRLSLPHGDYVRVHAHDIPIEESEAMIREVHIYGKVARLNHEGQDAQHLGLGRHLIEVACEIAQTRGYRAINVISSVGTREYYRALGFADNDLYQRKSFDD